MSQSIWKNRNYVRLFTANSTSSFGDMFDIIAMLMLFTYIGKAQPILIALIPVTYTFPSILFSQFTGIQIAFRTVGIITLLLCFTSAIINRLLLKSISQKETKVFIS
ncbi:hypothetical protein [Bacillus cereus group sp. BfR-BA-01380]|uniref:hypothetical protein n=1 Tax=Bacillus cereus group sp. BfR-BA-01380 TaxID=2920324 RepID=UPI001F5A1C91|nr:hypothetical protein [Bacillus cereus group sp. BfR-BA-01380]